MLGSVFIRRAAMFAVAVVQFASLNVFGATKQTVVTMHTNSLKITELEKIAPPYAAFMWALANEAGYQSLKNSNHPDLSYGAAFSRVLAQIKPSQTQVAEGWLDLNKLSASEKQAVLDAQSIATRIYNDFSQSLAAAEAPMGSEWPTAPGRGLWRPTPPAMAKPALPNWGKMGLFSGAKVEELTKDLIPPALGSTDFVAELDEVLRLGGVNSTERTADQTEIAKFWVGGAGTVTPPGLWIRIGLQRLQEVPVNFTEAVLAMRTLSYALCDAGIAAWQVKYLHQTWRPITAIHEDLADTTWQPLLTTPPFPGYVSGHSTFSSAAATVLGSILPLTGERLKVTSPDLPGVVRTFASYEEAALEAGKSRIYGGIHVEADNRDGILLGERVGCALIEKMYGHRCN
ncbi:MAG: vanadium-dependent haloperoxidase [Deltaproteobacteria bacterium]|nr:vanadium-dependent haloperoxidase [Deltaproteobacteria bacterium]